MGIGQVLLHKVSEPRTAPSVNRLRLRAGKHHPKPGPDQWRRLQTVQSEDATDHRLYESSISDVFRLQKSIFETLRTLIYMVAEPALALTLTKSRTSASFLG